MLFRINSTQQEELIKVIGPNRLIPDMVPSFVRLLEELCNDTHWDADTCNMVLSWIRDGMGYMLQKLFRDYYGGHPEFERVFRGNVYQRQPSVEEVRELGRLMEEAHDPLIVIERWKKDNPGFNLTIRSIADAAPHVVDEDGHGMMLFPRKF
ncbi:hypothetical protein QKT49_gp048 [Acanthamoeba castellanii medusavirus]|uniref:Uncharacterized protein n=1 Tax=Acanthamoeba castellanii medusavirus J1 TaxID=3114988 RepID=A0A3T1CWI7_9VIRU|nr:hypothetical protein QKT49_gp048 [Acanthamoeba castellanii medusavirus]BBI30188.1 hypothetical protein [Acanthamoeba castellanii medusavirus J1]